AIASSAADAAGAGATGRGLAANGARRPGDRYRGAASAGPVCDVSARTATTTAVVPRKRRRKTVGGALLPRVPRRCAERGIEPVNPDWTRARHKRAGVLPLLLAGALSCSGCDWFGLTPPTPPPPPADSQVLRGDSLVPEKQPEPGSPEAKLAGAHE